MRTRNPYPIFLQKGPHGSLIVHCQSSVTTKGGNA
jgi:hypothetical protein